MSDKHIDRDFTVAAGRAAAVVPDDDVDLARVSRGLYVGGAGNLTVILDSDTAAVTFIAVAVGSVLPIRVRRVMESTTATNLIALS